MKKFSLGLLVALTLSACTADFYTDNGNATIISSKSVGNDVVELAVQKDNGEIVNVVRKRDEHAAVGARINLADVIENAEQDLKTIRRYEFK